MPDDQPATQGFAPLRQFPPPPFLQKLGSTESVRTPGGHYRTESLFLELWKPIETARPVYSLLRDDREDPRVPGRQIYSFQKRYVEAGDITGYKAAIELLGSWKHWEKIRDRPWFRDHVAAWNAEIVASLNARGMDAIVKAADRGDLKAAEYLMGYTTSGPTIKPGRGRPSKAEIKQAAREAATISEDLDEDAARVLGVLASG
jgi:hypothetical protein